MIQLAFSIIQQKLNRTDNNPLVSNGDEIYKAHFDVSEEWNNAVITTIFTNPVNNTSYNVLLDDNNDCVVPNEALDSDRDYNMEVSVFGTIGASTITSTVIKIPVRRGAGAYNAAAEISLKIYEQIMSRLQEIDNEFNTINVEAMRQSIDAYIAEHPIDGIIIGEVEDLINRYVTEYASQIKGDKGDKGDNATITGVTASVDNKVGTPSVSVQMGGTERKRTFNFDFHNVKGEKGETGKSAYESAVENGYKGTEAEWVEEFANAILNASNADSKADNAVSTANSSNAKANNAVQIANSAADTAQKAVDTSTNIANGAVQTANSAVTTAQNAVTTANNAVTTAQNAVTTANSAVTTAQNAVSTANSAVDTVNNFTEDVYEAVNPIGDVNYLKFPSDFVRSYGGVHLENTDNGLYVTGTAPQEAWGSVWLYDEKFPKGKYRFHLDSVINVMLFKNTEHSLDGRTMIAQGTLTNGKYIRDIDFNLEDDGYMFIMFNPKEGDTYDGYAELSLLQLAKGDIKSNILLGEDNKELNELLTDNLGKLKMPMASGDANNTSNLTNNEGITALYGRYFPNGSNLPDNSNYRVFSIKQTDNYVTQLAFHVNSNSVYMRTKKNGTWGEWEKLLTKVTVTEEVLARVNPTSGVVTQYEVSQPLSDYQQLKIVTERSGSIANEITVSYEYFKITSANQTKVLINNLYNDCIYEVTRGSDDNSITVKLRQGTPTEIDYVRIYGIKY